MMSNLRREYYLTKVDISGTDLATLSMSMVPLCSSIHLFTSLEEKREIKIKRNKIIDLKLFDMFKASITRVKSMVFFFFFSPFLIVLREYF